MDYTINRTDSSKETFIIRPYTTNGLISPTAAITSFHKFATAANTSLVLLGKGMTDYGEIVAEDLVHMLENFASPTEPSKAIQGQLWYKNTAESDLYIYNTDADTTNSGTNKDTIVINGKLRADLNVNSHKIINVLTPIDTTDATNKKYVDDQIVSFGDTTELFVRRIGDTISGNLVISGNVYTGVDRTAVTITNTTTNTTTTSTLAYSSNITSQFSNGVRFQVSYTGTDTISHTQIVTSVEATWGGGVTTITTREPLPFITAGTPISGATISAIPSFNVTTGKSNFGGVVEFNSGFKVIGSNQDIWVGIDATTTNFIKWVKTPVDNFDAANKKYVDDSIANVVANIPTSTGGGSGGELVVKGGFNETVMYTDTTDQLPVFITTTDGDLVYV